MADQDKVGEEGQANADDISYRIDGDQWCATRWDFTDLQESFAGFGYSKEEARADLERQEQEGQHG